MAEEAKGVYRPRNPRATALYQILEDHFEAFVGVYDDRYERSHGFWRPVVEEIVTRYLDCGILSNGFARVKCSGSGCREELLVPFSCKAKAFCPSCAAKRRVELSAWLIEDIMAPVLHRLWTFTIPKMLRPWFKFDRALQGRLCLCAWTSLRLFLEQTVDVDDAMAGAVAGIHSAGKLLNAHPHIHILCTDGLIDPYGTFLPAPAYVDLPALAKLFRHQVFSMLLKAEKITPLIVEKMMAWHHSGFNVHRGEPIEPDDHKAVERVVAYLVQCPVSLERLTYLPEQDKVVYKESAKGEEQKTFTPLDFLADLSIHIPDRGKHGSRLYGIYSNAHRGALRRQAQTQVDQAPVIARIEEPQLSTKQYRLRWAELLRRVYEVNLVCPKCRQPMKIISFISDPDVIRKILVHLNLWDAPIRPPPARIHPAEHIVDLDHCQVVFEDISTVEVID